MSAPAIGVRQRFAPPSGKAVVDGSRPLAQGLIHCVHADGTSVIDLVSGRALVVQSGATATSSTFGSALRSTSSSGGAYLPLTAAPAYPLSFTWAGISRPAAGTGPGMLAFCYGNSGWTAEASPFLYGLERTSANVFLLAVSGSSLLSPNPVGGGTNTLSVVTGTMRSGEQILYADGQRLAARSDVLSAPTSTSLAGLGFCAYTQPGRTADHRASLGLVHSRVLSENEVAALSADPFQIFRQ